MALQFYLGGGGGGKADLALVILLSNKWKVVYYAVFELDCNIMLISIILHFSVLVISATSLEIDSFLIQIISVMTTAYLGKSKIACSKHLLSELMVPCSGSRALCQLFFFVCFF